MSNLFSKKLRYDSHKIHSFKVYNLVAFSIFTNFYSPHHYKFQNIFITPSILRLAQAVSRQAKGSAGFQAVASVTFLDSGTSQRQTGALGSETWIQSSGLALTSSEILSKLLGLSVTWIFLPVYLDFFTCKMRIIISSLGILKDCNT